MVATGKLDVISRLPRNISNTIKHWYGGLGGIRIILSYAIFMLTQRENIDKQTLNNPFHDMNDHYQLLRLPKP